MPTTANNSTEEVSDRAGPEDTGDPTEFFNSDYERWTIAGTRVATMADRGIHRLIQEVLEDYPDADLRHLAYILIESVNSKILSHVLDKRMGISR